MEEQDGTAEDQEAPIEMEEPMAGLETDVSGDVASLAPTEMLAAEYTKLMKQYDTEISNRKQLEEEIERIKAGL
jgi:hypothetical protein